MLKLQPQRSRHLRVKTFLLPAIGSKPFATLTSLFNLCTKPSHLQQIHARFILHGLHQNPLLSSKLIDCYANLGLLSLFEKVFQSINNPNADLFGSMVRNWYKLGEYKKTLLVYEEMVMNGMYPDEEVYTFVVKACASLSDGERGMKVHGHLMKLGFNSNDSVAAALQEMYRNCNRNHSERIVFDEMSVNRMQNWNSLITDASRELPTEDAFMHFRRIRVEGLGFDSATLINLLRSCVDLRSLRLGQVVHSLAVVSKSCDLSTSTALLTMYSKLGRLDDASMVFENISEKDIVVWNILISAYTRNGHPKKSIDLFRTMGKSGLWPDLFTVMAVLPALAQLKFIKLGKEIHGYITRHCLDHQVSVHNSVIDMYCEGGYLDYARRIFYLLKNKTGISWSTIIKGYVKHDQFLDAISLFSRMRLHGAEVDFVTVINILPAYVNIGALEQVKYLHGYTMKSGLDSLQSVNTAVLVSYAKCGCIDMARKLFDEEESTTKDLVAWNSMMSVCGKHGDWSECFELYSRMKLLGVQPDRITYTALLTACVNSGQVKEGKKYFKEMVETYGIQPNQEHYASMVDLLGRSGKISEARELIESMPFEPDARVWGPLLSACKMHSETRVAEFAAEKLISLEPENAGNYILLSNVYAAAGEWDGVAKMRSLLRDKSLKKIPGCSWLEINGKVHEFRVADKSHKEWEEIYRILGNLELESEAVAENVLSLECELCPMEGVS